jgi:hypothetical protein
MGERPARFFIVFDGDAGRRQRGDARQSPADRFGKPFRIVRDNVFANVIEIGKRLRVEGVSGRLARFARRAALFSRKLASISSQGIGFSDRADHDPEIRAACAGVLPGGGRRSRASVRIESPDRGSIDVGESFSFRKEICHRQGAMINNPHQAAWLQMAPLTEAHGKLLKMRAV